MKLLSDKHSPVLKQAIKNPLTDTLACYETLKSEGFGLLGYNKELDLKAEGCRLYFELQGTS